MYMRTIPSLRIIVAMVIAFESVISWMPMYGEIKLAFFVYLWYPKTKVLKFCSLREFLLIIMLLFYTLALEKFCHRTLSIESRSPFCCCPAQPRPINPNKDIALYGYGSIACKNRTEVWKRKQLHKLQKVSSDGGGPDGYDFDDDDIPMCDESRQQLSRKLPIASGKINPYRIVIILQLAILGLFFHYRIQNSVHDAYWLWLTSVICEIWFSFSWILDQFPKWYPIERETYLDSLSSRYEKEGKPSELAPIDIFVSTVDPMKEPPLITANTVLSILSVDYPIDKFACYVSDDGAAVLTFEAHTETGVFARKWVPFCKKYKIEPWAPEWYFAWKIDYLRDKVHPEFVRERRAMKKIPEGGWSLPGRSSMAWKQFPRSCWNDPG